MICYRCVECRRSVISFTGLVAACAWCGAGPIFQHIEHVEDGPLQPQPKAVTTESQRMEALVNDEAHGTERGETRRAAAVGR